jgi:hypothetical protein
MEMLKGKKVLLLRCKYTSQVPNPESIKSEMVRKRDMQIQISREKEREKIKLWLE